MSVDPGLLSHAGITVDELRADAVQKLEAAGYVTDLETNDLSPRLAIAIPALATANGAAVFIYLQYQVPARPLIDSDETVFGTKWSHWWGSNPKSTDLASEVRRGLNACVDKFLESQKKGHGGGA